MNYMKEIDVFIKCNSVRILSRNNQFFHFAFESFIIWFIFRGKIYWNNNIHAHICLYYIKLIKNSIIIGHIFYIFVSFYIILYMCVIVFLLLLCVYVCVIQAAKLSIWHFPFRTAILASYASIFFHSLSLLFSSFMLYSWKKDFADPTAETRPHDSTWVEVKSIWKVIWRARFRSLKILYEWFRGFLPCS